MFKLFSRRSERKNFVAPEMIPILSLILPLLLAGCAESGNNVEKSKEVRVETGSNYVFKKIYVKDKKGFTHEILTSSSGSTLGGVGMLELCVYKED